MERQKRFMAKRKSMIKIQQATIQDIALIQEVAFASWETTYTSILSQAQIDYMLDMWYKKEVLEENMMQKNHVFILAFQADRCLGFASYEHDYLNQKTTRLHKIYLLAEAQGKGVGKKLIQTIINLAKQNKAEKISLNVNKFNKAHLFYQKMGFEIIREIDLEIGNGYLMEDFVMEKKI